MNNQNGYTLNELILGIAISAIIITTLYGAGYIIYVAHQFINKFW
jgi:prepilin-type N-terminal cleavage/methylation domain-containing protein